MSQIPVTILTGFLGSGKTTLLNRILSEQHGKRIAVIENEFGETGIDNELLIQEEGEQIIEMNNGCICCTVRGDLVRILGELAARHVAGTSIFERVIIETTGLADPAPVAQTFFVDDDIARTYRLDAIITIVDAKHAHQQLDQHHEAQEQIGFADRILLSKTDLTASEDVKNIEQRLRNINSRAPVSHVNFGQTPLDSILDIRGFDLSTILEIEPAFLTETDHDHDDDIGSFTFRSKLPFDPLRLEEFLGAILQAYGTDLLRYKGVLFIKGMEHRVVLQGVHMMAGSEPGKPWQSDEERENRIVFIGRTLPQEVFERGLNQALITT